MTLPDSGILAMMRMSASWCPLNLHLFIGIFLIADKLMSLFFQLLGKSAQYFLGNSQRFQQYDFHTSFLL